MAIWYALIRILKVSLRVNREAENGNEKVDVHPVKLQGGVLEHKDDAYQ